MNAASAHQRSRTYYELAGKLSEPVPGLESEFARLFVGPGRAVAHPYESVHREGRTMGECTLDVRRRLAAEGVAPARNILPDHVGIEMAFMGHLASREAAAWEEGEADQAREMLLQQSSFLQRHLLVWLPQFCRRVLVGHPHAFYADLTRRAETFVTEDATRLSSWLGSNRNDSEKAPSPDSWAVAVAPGCTLCMICVQMCKPAALRHQRLEDAAILTFEPSACDGCRACQRWCPEMVISVDAASDTPKPVRELVRSDLLPCPGCGRPCVPEAMVDRIQTRMGSARHAARERLALCPECKTRGKALPKHNLQEE